MLDYIGTDPMSLAIPHIMICGLCSCRSFGDGTSKGCFEGWFQREVSKADFRTGASRRGFEERPQRRVSKESLRREKLRGKPPKGYFEGWLREGVSKEEGFKNGFEGGFPTGFYRRSSKVTSEAGFHGSLRRGGFEGRPRVFQGSLRPVASKARLQRRGLRKSFEHDCDVPLLNNDVALLTFTQFTMQVLKIPTEVAGHSTRHRWEHVRTLRIR